MVVQPNALPSEAFDALVERMIALVHAPWDAELMERDSDPAWRQVEFGQGLRLLSSHVDELAELIRIFDIAWIG
jgi:hypothetical protein